MRSLAVGAFFCLVLFLPSELFSRKSCGSASCPINTFRSLAGGWFVFGLSHEYIMQDQLYVGSSRSVVGAIRGHHDEVETLNQKTVLQFQLGLTDRLSLSCSVPFVHREHSHLQHEDSTTVWESWNFSGLGDMTIAANYIVIHPDDPFSPVLSLTGGIKLATGRTGVKNIDGEEAEITIQPGNGSVDGIVGLYFQQNVLTVPTLSGTYVTLPLSIGTSCQITGAGTDGYRSGNSLLIHAGTAYPLFDRASVLFQFTGKFQGYADVGTTDEPKENTGGTWLFASPGIGIQPAERLSGSAYVQIPFYQNVHGIQQTAPFNFFFTLSYNFDLLNRD